MTRRRQGVWLVTMLALAATVPPTSGCGGDEAGDAASKPNPPAKTKAAAGKGKGKATKGKGGQLDTYSQIDARFRQPFSEKDFVPDPGGDENRDPFRSYVIPQGEPSRPDAKGTVQPTDICGERNSRASGYSVRELRLIGIVLRGTRSFAQFRDPTGFGWIVRLRDCLGKEKALVDKIGAGFVTLEVVAEAAANAQAQSERRDVQLHPSDLLPSDEPVELPAPAVAPATP